MDRVKIAETLFVAVGEAKAERERLLPQLKAINEQLNQLDAVIAAGDAYLRGFKAIPDAAPIAAAAEKTSATQPTGEQPRAMLGKGELPRIVRALLANGKELTIPEIVRDARIAFGKALSSGSLRTMLNRQKKTGTFMPGARGWKVVPRKEGA